MKAEEERLKEAQERTAHWRRWGPFLSERQWGTVREDYSAYGTAWEFFPHDHARSRAYRWGEDGLAGISDNHQRLCFALTLWNGNDPILKERLFGLTGNEGNHGEDVKEYYFYLDSTPSQRRPSVTCSASIDRQPGREALSRRRGRGAPGSHDHVLRNHSVGSRCSGARSGPRLVAVMRTRMSSAEALAYSTTTSK